MDSPKQIDLETAEKLLDVVFGVLIGLSLLELPKGIRNLFDGTDHTEWNRVILLFTGLLYSAFYWLETRHFILKQHAFDNEIKRIDSEDRDGVPLPLATFLLGILGLMGFASAQLAFADAGDFLKFSYAAALFWCFDLCGTFSLKRQYKKEESKLALDDDIVTEGERWYIGHILSPFFYWYGLGNLAVFVVGILIVQAYDAPEGLQPWICTVYLAATLFRHLYLRSTLMEKVTNHYQTKAQQDVTPNA